jgi:hypothetical protein
LYRNLFRVRLLGTGCGAVTVVYKKSFGDILGLKKNTSHAIFLYHYLKGINHTIEYRESE